MEDNNISPLVAPSMGSAEEGVKRFKGIKPPYARGGDTPATQFLEAQCLEHLAKQKVLEESDSPFIAVTASGQAANHVVFKALQGGNLVSSSHLFGTTKVDLQKTFMQAGGDISWVDPCDVQAFIDNTTSNTTAWYLEAISNPAGRVPDLDQLSKAAKERDILLVLDTTLAVGMPKFNGLEHADIATVSLTKQAGGGENKNMGGAVIVGNDFNWHTHTDNFPSLKEYFTDAGGNLALPPNYFGALASKISLHEGSGAMAPQTALSIAHALPTMEGRVNKMCENAKMLAENLQDYSKVKGIQLAGFKTDSANDERAQQYLGDNHFVLLLDLKGGASAARDFINSGQFFHAVALGQQVTAISHPASSTHRQYPKDKLAAMGVHDGTIRISVGCEEKEELYKKMTAALAASSPAASMR